MVKILKIMSPNIPLFPLVIGLLCGSLNFSLSSCSYTKHAIFS